MPANFFARRSLGVIVALAALALTSSEAHAQATGKPKTPLESKAARAAKAAADKKAAREAAQKSKTAKADKATTPAKAATASKTTAKAANNSPKADRGAKFTDAVAQAKKSGRPLVVFGMSEGCSRCAALKQGLTTQPELKLLLTQYVSVELPFAGREYTAVFDDIIRQDEKYRQAIGAPSVFIFTAKENVVYAGPNVSGGMTPGDEFKGLLIEGIRKSGGLRGAGPAPSAADLAKARKLLDAKQLQAAAILLAPHVAANSPEEMAELATLTGLSAPPTHRNEELDSLAKEIADQAQPLVAMTIDMAAGDSLHAAVAMAGLQRVFAGYPTLSGRFDTAWKELLAEGGPPNLKQHAELIDQALQAELADDNPKAISIYERLAASSPGTPAAAMAQVKLSELKKAK